jgi:hypothetical protein
LNNESFDKDINSTKKEKNEKSNKLYLKRNTHTQIVCCCCCLKERRKNERTWTRRKEEEKKARVDTSFRKKEEFDRGLRLPQHMHGTTSKKKIIDLR